MILFIATMLDHVCIFRRSGVVLWSQTLTPLKGEPVNALIKDVLLEGKAGSSTAYTHNTYALQWLLANEHDLVLVAVYQKVLPLTYVESLLASLKKVRTLGILC
jgi:signal recognition particle receptor subunit alpha